MCCVCVCVCVYVCVSASQNNDCHSQSTVSDGIICSYKCVWEKQKSRLGEYTQNNPKKPEEENKRQLKPVCAMTNSQ